MVLFPQVTPSEEESHLLKDVVEAVSTTEHKHCVLAVTVATRHILFL